MPRRRTLTVAVAVAATAAALLTASAAATTRTVQVGDNYFVHASGVPTVTVRAGDTVRWKWVGRRPHDLRVASGPVRFASSTKRTGTYSRVINRRGTYTIVCDVHGARDQQMKLVVR